MMRSALRLAYRNPALRPILEIQLCGRNEEYSSTADMKNSSSVADTWRVKVQHNGREESKYSQVSETIQKYRESASKGWHINMTHCCCEGSVCEDEARAAYQAA